MGFPNVRMRERRKDEAARARYRETKALSPKDFIMPIFVKEGIAAKREIRSMPGVYQWPLKSVAQVASAAHDLGISGVILFGIPKRKDEIGSSAYDEGGIVQKAIGEIKRKVRGIQVIADVCLCEYTSHGHCGIIRGQGSGGRVQESETGSPKKKIKRHVISELPYPVPCTLPPEIDNDATIEVLAKVALSYARADADMVAPSAMMDGQVKAIKAALVDNGYAKTKIMSYSAKYASSFYGPFRDAAESPPKFGDRKTYQMDYHNLDEAVTEAMLDIEEGADMIMVKPALGYGDIIRRLKDELNFPLACYSVSGEYSMMKAAAAKGYINEREVALETLTGFKRAGAGKIITYYATEAARWLAK